MTDVLPDQTTAVEAVELDVIDDQLVRHQLAAIEVGADPFSQRRPVLHLRPQDVAGGDRRNPVFLRQPSGLGPLARSGRSEQDEVQRHGYLHGKPMDSA